VALVERGRCSVLCFTRGHWIRAHSAAMVLGLTLGDICPSLSETDLALDSPANVCLGITPMVVEK